MHNSLSKNKMNTRSMVKISILGGIAFILMFIKTPIAFLAPSFMSVDASDVPALIGGFAMGPVAGMLIQLIKNILKLPMSNTGGVGEISNFIVGSVLVIVSSIIYNRKKTYKNATVGLFFGVISMAIVATLSNYFVIFPLYAKIMVPMDTIIEMGTVITGKIVDLKTMMVFAILPFNLLKGFIEAILTMLLYKRISPILHK